MTITGTINAGVGVLSGNTSFSIVSASFTIPSAINRDYYIFCNANAATYTITLPTRLVNQIIHLRNFSGRTLSITAPTTTPSTSIYPAQVLQLILTQRGQDFQIIQFKLYIVMGQIG